MSFLYARNLNDELYVFSDSKVTFSPKEQDMLIKRIERFQEYRNNENSIKKLKNNLQEIQAEECFYKFIDQDAFKYAINYTEDDTVGGISNE